MSLTRRSFMAQCHRRHPLFDPTSLGADKTLTIALPNNPSALDPMQISNHDAMAITNAVFESAGGRPRRQCRALAGAQDARDQRRPDDLQVRPA